MIRQGDILLIPVTSIPATYEQRKPATVTIGHGEVTGHHHVLKEAAWLVAPETTAEALFRFGANGQTDAPLFVYIDEGGTVLEHPEHAAIDVPTGTYRVVRQREYTPQAIRSVMD